MLNNDDMDRLQMALDWVRRKSPKDDVKDFVFSSEDFACEASKTLCEVAKTLAKGVKVKCLGQTVSVTRPHDPDALRRFKGIIELNRPRNPGDYNC